jgi:GGDEF domain-containing protein
LQAHFKREVGQSIEGSNFAVLLFDMDGFNDVSDVFGHALASDAQFV